MNSIGEKIYELRKKQGLSQEQFAEKINVSRQIVSQWENNVSMPKFDKIELICKTFNVNINYFLLEGNTEEYAVDTADVPPTDNKQAEKISPPKKHIKAKKILLIILMIISATIFIVVLSTAIYLLIPPKLSDTDFEVITSHSSIVSDDILFLLFNITEISMIILFVYAIKKYIKLKK